MRAGLLFAALYAALCMAVYLAQETLIFNRASAQWQGDYTWPTGARLDWLNPAEGVQLRSLFLPHEGEQRLGAVAYFKGNAGNLSDIPWLSKVFRRMGYDVYAYDYRGFGQSTGAMSEAAMLEDALYFHDWVQGLLGDEAPRVVAYSLGTSFASHVIKERRIEDAILFAPMKSVVDLGQRFYPFLPTFLSRYPLRSDRRLAAASSSQIVIYHGLNDRIVPHASGKALADAALGADDAFLSFDGADHGSIIKDERVIADIVARWGAD